jgi:hypothetical protein
MRISVKNEPTGRRIIRADKPTSHSNYGYNLIAPNTPAIKLVLTGQDSKSYEVALTDTDIDAINKARERYAEHFDAYAPKGSKPTTRPIVVDDAQLKRETLALRDRDGVVPAIKYYRYNRPACGLHEAMTMIRDQWGSERGDMAYFPHSWA